MQRLSRPLPPADLVEHLFSLRMRPAPDVEAWARATFIAEDGDLYNPDHQHLLDADVRFMWASDGYQKQGRRIVGLTEKLQIMASPWAKARQEQQLYDWFGHVPDFLITLDALHCAQCDDLEFCALVEHELYHVGHQLDEFGNPAFTKDGQPRLGIRGHDVEEFVGVVARYGVGSVDGNLAKLILAAAKGPTVAPIRISQACGTCQLRAA